MIDFIMQKEQKYQEVASILLRFATALNFLSPVASRLSLWGQQSSGWTNFLSYTAEVNSFAPEKVIPHLAYIATILEIMIGILLIVGYKTRWAAIGASVLTFIFALAMTYSFGIKTPLDYAVFVDCTSAFLLATLPSYKWSIDEWILKRQV